MSIESTIQAYFGELEKDEHHRYRSWEHCYKYFQTTTRSRLMKNQHEAAIQLGFFLASWGMYRGRSFLLQRAYTAHLAAIECLADPRWSTLWDAEFGARDEHSSMVAKVVELRSCLGEAYQPHVPTDILASKIMLGTLGCSPACDRYFVDGFTSEGHAFSYFNAKFVTRVLQFSRENETALRRAQRTIEETVRTRYPLMKLVDMYFFQIGCERNA